MKARIIDIQDVKVACSECSLRELCLPLGLDEAGLNSLGSVIKRTRKLKKGDFLYRVGDPLTSLYAVSKGSIKTCELSASGQIQITGFHLTGELVGVDGISTERHHCDAIALEPTELCELPYVDLEAVSHKVPSLQHQLFKLLSREIVQDGELLLMVGKMNAEERLATSLLSFSQRYSRLGLSGTQFRLSMSRQDLGDYLGLALETVSRLFSRFQDEGLLHIEGRNVDIINLEGLLAIAGQSGSKPGSQAKL